MAAPGRARMWPGARVAVLSPTPSHPQDFGNRKRIYAVCKRYADEGALVTFIHYPAELEWRGQLPWRAERTMSDRWAQHFTIAPTRELHSEPRGLDHTIDEWWDPAIGDFLTWLFSVQSFDIFIVNYSWLSKALDYAPRSAFKILDTHDKFSGRRAMLQSLNLFPEFFHTTEDEERIALDRADLVWAIKREEAAELARLTKVPVLALPHLDPPQTLKRPEPDPDGYFRVGIIGARNNVNRMNIGEFVRAAEPVLRDAFAPVKLVVAGTVCGLLEDIDSPFVELRGRVDNVEDFYRSVDCVAVPMRASTGLKIKTGEALSLGVPVLSLAHAFEGYEPAHELHRLEEFSDMARAIVDLAFAPREALDALAKASLDAHRKTQAAIAETFRHSDALARERRQLVVLTVDSRAFVDGTIFSMVLSSVRDYLTELGAVIVLVVRGRAADVAANADAVDAFRRVVVADDLPDSGALRAEIVALGAEVVEVAEFLKRAQPAVVIADAAHPALAAGCTPDAVLFSRVEMMALSEGRAGFDVPAKGYARAYAATPAISLENAQRAAGSGAEIIAVPCLRRSNTLKFNRARDRSGMRSVALLGTPGSPAVRLAAIMARSWQMRPFVVASIGEQVDPGADLPSFVADDYIDEILKGRRPPPSFAVDLSSGQPGLPLCRELLDRLHVPVVATSTAALHRSFDTRDDPLKATTEHELWMALRFLALEPHQTHTKALKFTWSDLESNRGWAWIARYCAKLFETKDAQFT